MILVKYEYIYFSISSIDLILTFSEPEIFRKNPLKFRMGCPRFSLRWMLGFLVPTEGRKAIRRIFFAPSILRQVL